MSKTIKDFHGDDVWRDDEGQIWVRIEQLTDAVSNAIATKTEMETEMAKYEP